MFFLLGLLATLIKIGKYKSTTRSKEREIRKKRISKLGAVGGGGWWVVMVMSCGVCAMCRVSDGKQPQNVGENTVSSSTQKTESD